MSLTPSRSFALSAALLLATAGLLIAALLIFEEKQPAEFGLVCGAAGSCQHVLSSRYAHIGHIPLAAVGVGFYALLIALWCAILTTPAGKFRSRLLLFCLTLTFIAALVSACLLVLQIFFIKAICPLCCASATDCFLLFSIFTYLRRHGDFDAQPLAALAGTILLAAVALMTGLAYWLPLHPIVGRVGWNIVTADQMDRELGLPYRTLQWQTYQMQHDWLQAKLGTIALNKEAASLGLSTADLVHQKVDQEVNDQIDNYVLTQHAQASQEEIAAFRQQTFAKLDDPARAKYILDLVAKYGGADYLPLPPITEDDLAAVQGWHRGADAKTAKARLVVFSDFTCEFCAQMAPTLDDVMAKYGTQVSWTFRYLPHPAHDFSMDAAIAAECAGQQGKFWEYHDALMKHASHLEGVDFASLAVQLGLDVAQFTQCQQSDPAKQAVQKSLDQATSMGLFATPVVFLNGKRIGGLVEEKDLIRQIRDLLAD